MSMIFDEEPIHREDVLTMYGFIKKITELGVKLPTLMFSDNGTVGVYWDDNVSYADVDLERAGKLFAIYTRFRPDHTDFFADFTVDEVNQEWVNTHLLAFKE